MNCSATDMNVINKKLFQKLRFTQLCAYNFLLGDGSYRE
jgi:hypothetical protein